MDKIKAIEIIKDLIKLYKEFDAIETREEDVQALEIALAALEFKGTPSNFII